MVPDVYFLSFIIMNIVIVIYYRLSLPLRIQS